MAHVSFSLRIVYCVAVIGAALPLGLASSSWVSLGMGRGGFGMWSLLLLLPLMLLGGYRVVLVIRDRSTLDAPSATGLARFLRVVGIVMLVLGACVSVLNLIAKPLMRALMSSHTESGAEYFVAGMYLALLGGIGTSGLLLFELSRLLSFEKAAKRAVA